MEIARTRELFSPLIKKPPLTDQLLQRPPFKFIHDVLNETIKATGYLSDFYTPDELDSAKAGADKASKMSFLEKLIDVLNVDGSLNDVNPTKIIAGKEPELTNLLLQKLAIEATKVSPIASNGIVKESKSKSSKEKSSKKSDKSSEKSSKSSEKSSKDKSSSKDKPKEKSSSSKSRTKSKEKEEKLSSAESDKKEKERKKSKSEDRKKSKSEDRSKSKDRKSTKDKEKSSSKSKKESKRNSDAGIDVESPPDTIVRESSGGTSKGDDSGIAEETGAESERHDHEFGQNRAVFGSASSSAVPDRLTVNDETGDTSFLKRPGTAAASVRPQTSMGRPGTAAARPAPPKVKKTKVADIDTTVVSAQPVAFEKSAVIREDDVEATPDDSADNFLIEEDEIPIKQSGVAIDEIAQGDDHGQLVNRIIENTRELEKDAPFDETRGEFYDINEQRKLRQEIESIQKAIQKTTQTTHPLARTMEFLTEDFDLMLREIEENRKQAAKFEQQARDQAARSNEASVSLSATLRSLDAEIKDVKAQIGQSMARIIENEKKIHAFLF